MSDIRASWNEVGERLDQLGLKLQLHLEQAAADGRTEDEDRIREALRNVGEAVDQAFTALGGAAKDDAVREDLKDVGRTVIDALDATFAEVSGRFRSLIKDR